MNDFIIRKMERRDKETVIAMMRTFYTSPAVLTNGSEKIFDADVEACISDSPYLEGYVFECGEEIYGYGMLAKSFSTEFGRRCIWIEDLFVKEEHRHRGIGSSFFAFAEEIPSYTTAAESAPSACFIIRTLLRFAHSVN